FGGRSTERDSGVEDARAVQVNSQSHRVRSFANLAGHAEGHYRTAGHVVGIFDRNERGRRDVIGRVVMNRAADRIPIQQPVVARDWTNGDAGDGGGRAHLVVENVAALFDHDLGSGARL